MASPSAERDAISTGEAVGRMAAPVSRHTRLVRKQEALAKGVIWGAAGLTMTILVLIVGFIIVNGLYTRRTSDYPVTPLVQESVIVGEAPEVRISFLAHGSLRLQDLTFDELRELFAGRTSFWGYITGQNRRTHLLVYGGDEFRAAAGQYLLGEEAPFGPHVSFVGSPEETDEELRRNHGALAVVPAAWQSGEGAPAAGRVVGVRQASVAVHPDVTALQAGRRLRSLTLSQVRELLSGGVTVWSEVGGPSVEIEAADLSTGYEGVYEPLPVVPVYFDERAPAQRELGDRVLGGRQMSSTGLTVGSIDEFRETVASIPGAIGVVRRPEALAANMAVVEVARTTHSVNLRPSFFVTPPSRAGAVGGVSTIIINTLAMIAFVLLLATPLGVSAAVYLVEYAKQGRLLRILRIGTDTLAGVPSIIFGLFGMVFFAQFLGFKTGLISGTLTLTLMILPTVIRTSEEALRSVPDALRHGSMGLGATKHQSIVHVVLPAASPGILTGIILGIGRAVGETAALLFTMGSNLALIRSLNSPIRVLSVHLYMLIRENISLPNAFATATILVLIVFLVNWATRRLIGKMSMAART